MFGIEIHLNYQGIRATFLVITNFPGSNVIPILLRLFQLNIELFPDVSPAAAINSSTRLLTNPFIQSSASGAFSVSRCEIKSGVEDD